MRELELLAPAKDINCGKAAIDCGADAVYIGASRFGARQAAGNSIEDIAELCRYAHQYGCKVYVTVNTIIYDNELEDTQRLLDSLGSIGVDAILTQDMAITKLHIPKGVALHASTQTDNRSAEKAAWLSNHGFERVVLARELTLEEIKEIHKTVPGVELEAFVHGALCVSYSGVCYASEHCYSRSANRGACAQFCRMKFDLLDGDMNTIESGAHLLSLKDMCRIEELEELADAGITSFKIEGRLKDINYVRNVTAAYSKQLDKIISKRSKNYQRASLGTASTTFEPNLKKTFNRGFTKYFQNGRTSDLASFYTPKAMGEYVGKVKEIRGNSFNVAGTSQFANGDGLCFINSKNELEGFRINKAEGNRLYPQRLPHTLKPGMSLYRNSDQNFEKLLNADSCCRRIPINLIINTAENGIQITAAILQTDISVNVIRNMPLEKARTPQTDNIRKQLSKFGNTIFNAESIIMTPTEQTFFVPNSILSSIRQEITERLQEEITLFTAKKKKAKETTEKQYKHGHLSMQTYPQPYMYNIANHLAKAFYKEEGMNSITPAYEIEKIANPLIMQCRYCLRYEIGQCKKTHPKGALKEPLRIRLGDGHTFRLDFDCRHCQMNIYAE